MSSAPRIHSPMTLEEFLLLPEIDERPYLEYIDGKVEAKVSPQKKHSLITTGLTRFLDDYSVPRGLGRSFVELRCTFAGRSIIPDVVFLIPDHVPLDENGEAINETLVAPDIHIEMISPEQSAQRAREKLHYSTSHGCPLGWLINPERRTIDVYRSRVLAQRLPLDGFLDGDPVLPGFRLFVAELFSWMKPFILKPPGMQSPSPGDASS